MARRAGVASHSDRDLWAALAQLGQRDLSRRQAIMKEICERFEGHARVATPGRDETEIDEAWQIFLLALLPGNPFGCVVNEQPVAARLAKSDDPYLLMGSIVKACYRENQNSRPKEERRKHRTPLNDQTQDRQFAPGPTVSFPEELRLDDDDPRIQEAAKNAVEQILQHVREHDRISMVEWLLSPKACAAERLSDALDKTNRNTQGHNSVRRLRDDKAIVEELNHAFLENLRKSGLPLDEYKRLALDDQEEHI